MTHPTACRACDTTEAACEGGQLVAAVGRCCASCDHPEPEPEWREYASRARRHDH